MAAMMFGFTVMEILFAASYICERKMDYATSHSLVAALTSALFMYCLLDHIKSSHR